MLKVIAVGAVWAAALLGVACTDDNGNGGSTGSENGREVFIQDAEDRLSALRSELEELKDDIASGDLREVIDQQARAVEQRIDEAESELDDIRASNDDEWEALKERFDEALGEAGSLLDDIGSELGID